MSSIREQLKQYEAKTPEIVFEWTDAETGAQGWTVINTLRGGSAGGGTRMRKGLDRNEVLSLAKTMEVKFAVSGPPIGGAKSGINFDPADPRKDEVLHRWFKAVMPLLKTYYGTGGDMNVDEMKVIEITSQYGLKHPQEGTLKAHFNPNPTEEIVKIGQLDKGVTLPVTDPAYAAGKGYNVADMITGWGVSEAVRHYYTLWGGDIKGKRAIVQGWGNVAAAAAYYLAQNGAKIVGIIDRNGGVINKDGFSFEEVRDLFNKKQHNTLIADNMLSAEELEAQVWDVPAEILVPGAASRLVTKEQLERMKKAGLEVISCGANVPFKDPDIFFGPTGIYADENFSVVPDFIANCGMARVFYYLMQSDISMTDRAIFEDASQIIFKTMKELHDIHTEKTGIMEAAFGMILKRIQG